MAKRIDNDLQNTTQKIKYTNPTKAYLKNGSPGMRRTHLTLYLRGFFFIALLVYIFHIITFTGLCISYYYIYWFIYFILPFFRYAQSQRLIH
jgi:hypothetical protein